MYKAKINRLLTFNYTRLLNSQLHRPNPHQQISLLPEFTDTINPRSPKQVLAALQEKGIPITSTNCQHLIPLQGEYPVI